MPFFNQVAIASRVEGGGRLRISATNTNDDVPNVLVVSDAEARGKTAVIDHNDGEMSVVVGHAVATVTLDDDAVGGVWNSGEELPVTLADADVNRKALNDEDIDVSNPVFTIVPSIRVGNPITLANSDIVEVTTTSTIARPGVGVVIEKDKGPFTIDKFSDIARFTPGEYNITSISEVTFRNVTTGKELKSFLEDDTNAYVKDIRGNTVPVTIPGAGKAIVPKSDAIPANIGN